MKILIIYGTVEGQTRKISRFMENVLQENGHQVVVSNASEDPPSPEAFDAVLVGSSIHIHNYNPLIKDYVHEHIHSLNNKPGAFFSVSMAVASSIKEEHEEAEQIAENFLKETGWNTRNIWHIAGALKYTKYNYFKKLIMRSIAKKEGGSIDTDKDHEYTDWSQIKSKVLQFIANLKI
ncbi:MAG: flavodoxin domain-containing protein [Bacteroidota bacterium]|uniref:Flavodoxin domain-containing protein n=1 Tax=Flagellimonas okinawensis TaxID=3031324 RepID=A0ABT5XR37_9FLAO|nr:flavodoxin domain-containing protein [[Muricauda] okinawensis]MDF0708056.1 flavodoxin domain-containing protein [[Muricauda] okinawensis]MEC8831126.1 flavodoxin domain-containing protein [Bacteroidota bacterium]